MVEELRRREDLREFLRIKEEVPRTAYVYTFHSKFDLLYSDDSKNSKLYNKKEGEIQNSSLTDVSIDLNWFRKPVKQRDLESV